MERVLRASFSTDASVSCKPRFFPRLVRGGGCFSAFQFVIETPPEPFDSEVGTSHGVFEPLG
jgi:hypothetical protein